MPMPGRIPFIILVAGNFIRLRQILLKLLGCLPHVMHEPQQPRSLGRAERSCEFRGEFGHIAGMFLQRLPFCRRVSLEAMCVNCLSHRPHFSHSMPERGIRPRVILCGQTQYYRSISRQARQKISYDPNKTRDEFSKKTLDKETDGNELLPIFGRGFLSCGMIACDIIFLSKGRKSAT